MTTRPDLTVWEANQIIVGHRKRLHAKVDLLFCPLQGGEESVTDDILDHIAEVRAVIERTRP